MARSHGALYRTIGEFLSYLKERHVKRVIDAGVDAIFMEEPEFWARAGYSESFKKEWKNTMASTGDRNMNLRKHLLVEQTQVLLVLSCTE